MAFGVTATGFVPKTQEQILQELNEEQKANISANINTSPTEPIGQLNAIFSRKLRELWELGQALASAATIDGASGFFLDQVTKLTGTTRKGATKSQVSLDLSLDAGAGPVPIGSIVAVSGDATKRFLTTEVADNTAGGSPAVITVAAEAETEGPVSANAGTVTVIVTTVAGWTAVTNPEDAAEGQVSESDFDLRVRQQTELGGLGAGTAEAITANLSALECMLAVTVIDNDTGATVDSVPPHTIEAVIYDGSTPACDDDDIAQTIWNAKKAGVGTAGSDSGTAVDSENNSHTVNFTRATNLDMYLEVDISVNANTFPVDGLTLVRDAVVEFGDANFSVGDDVILSQFCEAIFGITGVEDIVEIRIDVTPSPAQTTNYVVGSREIADLDTGRTTVATV